MEAFDFPTAVVDPGVRRSAAARFREQGVVLPTFSQLAHPERIPAAVTEQLASVGPDEAHPLNLFRVHWYNGRDRRSRVEVPEHLVLGPELTGVEAPIIVLVGRWFPMIRAHKVLAAYGCLAPRITTGQFDPGRHRALWPSTGNYCRGGVAISKIMGCRGVAILPEGMSRERFEWLEHWTSSPDDVIRTYGTESNVKEIYDACGALAKDPGNVIFNQFREFANHVVHRTVTGRAAEHVFEAVKAARPGLELVAYVSATGSAGTLAAGDHLKARYGARIAAVEAQECPTLTLNGFGEHNIQGIGDKHVPFIHNAMNTDFVVAISDRATDRLELVFNSDEGRRYLAERRGVPEALLERLGDLGFSSICNVLAAIKIARHQGLGPSQAILTVATDGQELYGSETDKILETRFGGRYDEVAAAEAFGEHVLGAGEDWVCELGHKDRERIFNLGYFTWVEQQGVSVENFQARRSQAFWQELAAIVPVWDGLIEAFNADAGAA